MEYTIIASNTLKLMVANVKDFISRNWIPIGGISSIASRQQVGFHANGDRKYIDIVAFHQAMTRTRKPKPTKNTKPFNFISMDVVDLYNNIFQLEKVTKKRAPIPALLARINTLSNEHFNTLEEWAKFFKKLKLSPFLMGDVPPKPGYQQFKLKLEWLIKPANLAKIIDGNFHGE